MTNEEIRIAVAEACGIVAFEHKDGSGLWSARSAGGVYYQYKGGIDKEHCQRVCFPNYPEDLNACADFVNHMTEYQRGDFEDLLYDNGGYHATALQRCTAFMKVKGLWK